MTNLSDVIIWLSIAYALLGVLLLVICVFAKVPWPVKAGAVILTSSFYVVSFFDARPARLVFARSSAAEIQAPGGADRRHPHSLEGDPVRIRIPVGRGARRGQLPKRRAPRLSSAL